MFDVEEKMPEKRSIPESVLPEVASYKAEMETRNDELLRSWGLVVNKQDLTDLERSIFDSYQTGGFFIFNSIMRGKEEGIYPPLLKSHKKTIELMKQSLAKNRLSHDLLLCRLITEKDNVPVHKEGETFSDPAFLSASANPEFLESGEYKFSDNKRTVLQYIEVPKGTEALVMPRLASQDEVLLQSGTQMSVLNSKEIDGFVIQHVEVITPENGKLQT